MKSHKSYSFSITVPISLDFALLYEITVPDSTVCLFLLDLVIFSIMTSASQCLGD